MPIIPEWIVDEARYHWERLAVREKINSIDPKVIFTTAVVSIFILLVVIITLLWPNKTQVVTEYKKAWFYDLNTGQLFLDKSSKVPPIDAPSGPQTDGSKAGVGAYVYSYVPQPSEADRIVGYLWKPDPRIPAGYDYSSERWDIGKLIKRPQDKNWVPADSKHGVYIRKEAYKKNVDGVRPRYCFPK